LVKDGLLTNIDEPVKIIPVGVPGDEHKNPGFCRDDKGTFWISVRVCDIKPDRGEEYQHPNHYQNYLYLGKLNEDKLTISELKEIKPEEDYYGLQWGIEDVRLFWRKDGLHGIGVAIPVENGVHKIRQVEILLDHKKGTYRLLKDHGRPFGHMEKNWSPPEVATDKFDFVYSPTQIVKDGEVIGEPNDLFIHNGSQLLEFEDGYISIAHTIPNIAGMRTYASLALKFNAEGYVVAHSQFFHFDVGWRPHIPEQVEFISTAIWAKGKVGKELLVGIGVKDEALGIARLPVEKLKWEPYQDTIWYTWQYHTPPTR